MKSAKETLCEKAKEAFELTDSVAGKILNDIVQVFANKWQFFFVQLEMDIISLYYTNKILPLHKRF